MAVAATGCHHTTHKLTTIHIHTSARSSDMKTGRMLVIDEEGKDGGGLDEEMPSGDPLLYRDRTVSNPVG
eukprot:8672235-Lingulodinium_polyedra.AAC.1